MMKWRRRASHLGRFTVCGKTAAKLNTARDMKQFSCAFVVSQELVKNCVDHLKYLKFSKDLRNNATAEKRRNRVAKKFDDYNRDEVVLSGGLRSLYVVELDTYDYLKNALSHGKQN